MAWNRARLLPQLEVGDEPCRAYGCFSPRAGDVAKGSGCVCDVYKVLSAVLDGSPTIRIGLISIGKTVDEIGLDLVRMAEIHRYPLKIGP